MDHIKLERKKRGGENVEFRISTDSICLLSLFSGLNLPTLLHLPEPINREKATRDKMYQTCSLDVLY